MILANLGGSLFASCLIIIYLLSTGRVNVQRVSLREPIVPFQLYANRSAIVFLFLTFNYHINIVVDVINLKILHKKINLYQFYFVGSRNLFTFFIFFIFFL